MRLLIAAVQTALIVGIGAWLFGVTIIGPALLAIFFVALGALASWPLATSSPPGHGPRSRPTP
jgi:hypothetical protein